MLITVMVEKTKFHVVCYEHFIFFALFSVVSIWGTCCIEYFGELIPHSPIMLRLCCLLHKNIMEEINTFNYII
jgi:hypothetical protein